MVSFAPTPAEGVIWSFYDSFAAFPSVAPESWPTGCVAQLVLREYSEVQQSSIGGFTVCWMRLGSSDEFLVRLEAYNDGFTSLHRSRIAELLASLPSPGGARGPTPDAVIAALVENGWVDQSEELNRSTSPCPSCGAEGFEGDAAIRSWRRRVAAVTSPPPGSST